jgi:hypothetical protein
MARVAVNRANVTSGVIDPLMWDRFDVAQWHNALSDGVNLTILPQGGFRRRDGARTRSRLRRVLTPISWADAVFTAPNGGTTSAAIDGNTATEFRTTATVVAGTPLTVFEIALPQPVSLAAVDLTGFACQLLTADAALGLEVSNDGITWALFGRRVNVRTVAHNRRFANAPGIATVARFVRVSVVSAQALGTIGFKDLALWTETSTVSTVRRFDFVLDGSRSFLLVATDRNVDVFYKGEWQAAVAIPHRADQLPAVTRAQRDAVLILFHPDVAPRALFRQGSNTEWDSYDQTFLSIPVIDLSTVYGNRQDEQQRLSLTIADNIGFAISVGFSRTATIVKSSTFGVTTQAAGINAAIQALVPGCIVTVLSLTPTTLVFTLGFSGVSGNKGWSQVTIAEVGAQNEQQQVAIAGITDGMVFRLTIDGQTTTLLTKSQSTRLASDTASAINALSNVDGCTVTVSVQTANNLVFSVEFAGASGGRAWPPMTVGVFTSVYILTI